MELVQDVVVQNTLNDNLIQVSWSLSTNTDFSKYVVYRSPVAYANFTKIAEVDINTNYYIDTIIELMPINEWYYKVVQADSNGQEGPAPTDGIMFTKYNAFDVPRITGPFTSTMPDDNEMRNCFLEVRSRNLWMLQNDGEPMILLKRKYSGTVCPCIDDADGSDQCPTPLDKVNPCYGTGYLGGYYPSLQIMVRRINQQRNIPLNTVGFELDMQPTMWTIWSPKITKGDILIDSSNRRWEVDNTHYYHWRELITHQDFQVTLKKPSDIVYKVPVLSYLYWGDGYWGTGYYGNQLL